jgi:FADH2 O2-dependent halogenase
LPYEERMTVGAAIWEDFVRLYYRLRPVFTHFLESADHRLGILRLLQGEVYDRDDASVLGEIRRFVREVEGSDDHPLRDALADIRPA